MPVSRSNDFSCWQISGAFTQIDFSKQNVKEENRMKARTTSYISRCNVIDSKVPVDYLHKDRDQYIEGSTLEPKNTGTVALFSFIFSQIFSIFSKSTQNYKMLYIPYERPKKWVFNFTKTKGMATPKRQPRPWE